MGLKLGANSDYKWQVWGEEGGAWSRCQAAHLFPQVMRGAIGPRTGVKAEGMDMAPHGGC